MLRRLIDVGKGMRWRARAIGGNRIVPSRRGTCRVRRARDRARVEPARRALGPRALLRRLVDYRRRGRRTRPGAPLPARSVALTFDDGEQGFLDIGIPLLEKYRIPATSFLIGDGSETVKTHASPYVSFQSHSFDMHRAGGTVGHGGIVSALTVEQITADIKQSQELIGGTQAFAYPFGDVTDEAEQAVADAGVVCAFTTVNSWASIGDDPMALPRARISGEYEQAGFEYIVTTGV